MHVVTLAKYVPNPDGSPPELAESGYRLRRDDTDAPILQLAELGVVGDALDILPAVIAELAAVPAAR